MVAFFSRRHRRHEHFVLKLRVTLLPSVKPVTILQSAASNHTVTLYHYCKRLLTPFLRLIVTLQGGSLAHRLMNS